MNDPVKGLTTQEAEARRKQCPPDASSSVTKSKGQIYRENIVTLFNFLNFGIAGLLFFVGAYSNMLFLAIILLNIVIGISQELKAKKLVDQLSLLNRPQITVLRDGAERSAQPEDIVVDDVILLESGRQICCDSVLITGTLEVNESLLTGESDAVIKEPGAKLYSGSSVISGKGYARVIHVGSENYAAQIANDVKKEKQTESELLSSIRRVSRFTSLLIIPLGILLLLEAVFLRNSSFSDAVVFSAAALLGMLPKGLVLLISVSLAAGVIRLSQKRILVQNIYALETLARADTLCLDKTGTITDGNMSVKRVLTLPDKDLPANPLHLLRSYLSASDDNNATIQALRNYFAPEAFYQLSHQIAFSSLRKWGSVSFEPLGTLFIGAPEKLAPGLLPEANRLMDEGLRVVAVSFLPDIWTDRSQPPCRLTPLFLIALEDNLRKNIRETLDYFWQEGVDIKIISGDHLKTVSMTAQKAGLQRWMDGIDLSQCGESVSFDEICETYAVFARVTPRQKQQLIQALKRQGHCVAMTGDGVNDLLALREADCSIAVSEGSDASRQLSQIVLLDPDFTHLPQVVLEGRRVINHITRTAGVFFVKTIYSVLTSLFCLACNIPFPFIPIQITLVDACVEAYPSFLTIFESNTQRPTGRFLNTALKKALPFGMAVTIMIILVSLAGSGSAGQKQTLMYLLLIVISMAAVVKSCVPFSRLRLFLCTTMAAGTAFALWLLPGLFHLTAL